MAAKRVSELLASRAAHGRELNVGTDVTAVVVIGSGVVGTATGLGLASSGIRVGFYDTSAERTAFLRTQGLEVWSPAELLMRTPNAYLISVPTPTVDGAINLDFVRAAAIAVGQAIAGRNDWCCVVIRSTVPPGTTEEVLRPLLERHSGKLAGRDFGLAMNPEFLRAAAAAEDFVTPRVIVIGALDERSDEAVRVLYSRWSGVPQISMGIRTAEATKYVSNLFNATKISFFNELDRVLRPLSVDVDLAFCAAAQGAEGLWNPRYGTRGGLPYGGVCLPKDTVAFASFASDRGEHMTLLLATIAVNVETFAVAEAAVGVSQDDAELSSISEVSEVRELVTEPAT